MSKSKPYQRELAVVSSLVCLEQGALYMGNTMSKSKPYQRELAAVSSVSPSQLRNTVYE
ncbi:hypothetical protein [Motilimonas sp. E26]|uniref:hypothetical protein n=1 Tax=Motilimonas sp. E26 TaxID=2865674 RepID=UPI001E38E797|nr:hypothetical protein [Motilimonas sp. E26]MCE0557055.1 hypothetical protein [Motilimonas sp. E26]